MPKRGQNEGTIFEEAPGKWRASISAGWRNGKRIRKTFTAETRREVQEKLAKALRDQQLGLNVAPERRTLAQFLDTWLREVAKGSVRPKTYRTYADIVRLHVSPSAIGGRLLGRLEPQDVQTFLNDKLGSALCPHCKRSLPFAQLPAHVSGQHGDEKKKPMPAAGLGARTVRHIHATLRCALAVAVRWDLAPRNVATLVDPPRAKKPEIRAFTADEARRYLEAAHGDRLETLFTVAVALGLRQGEILGLAWEHVDFETGILTVSRALQRVASELQFVETKPGRSRVIMLPAIARSALLAHRARQERERILAGEQWQNTGLVFTSTLGTPLDARNVIRRHHAALRRAQLPRTRFHDLRHSAATLLLAQGVSPKYIADLLGHSQVAFTMQTYAHVLAEAKREVATQMDAILGPVATSVATSTPTAKLN